MRYTIGGKYVNRNYRATVSNEDGVLAVRRCFDSYDIALAGKTCDNDKPALLIYNIKTSDTPGNSNEPGAWTLVYATELPDDTKESFDRCINDYRNRAERVVMA